MLRRIALALVAYSLSSAPVFAQREPLTLARAAETVRLMRDWGGQSIFYSPDGTQFVMLAVRGDVERDGIWAELLHGDLSSLDGARPRTVARLFTSGLGRNNMGANELTMPRWNTPQWLDEGHIALRWSDADGTNQIFAITLRNGNVRPLTQHAAGVADFVVGDGGVIQFAGLIGRDRATAVAALEQGFTVTNTDFVSLLEGRFDGSSSLSNRDFRRFLIRNGGAPLPMRVDQRPLTGRYIAGQGVMMRAARRAFSPDNAWLIVDGSPSRIDPQWAHYDDPRLARIVARALAAPDDLIARELQQLYLVDARTGMARPLWDAPALLNRGAIQVAWSPDASRFLIGPTYLPLTCSGRTSHTGFAVVERASGVCEAIPFPDADTAQDLAWTGPGSFRVDLRTGESQVFRRGSSGWRGTVAPPAPARLDHAISVRIVESADLPPELHATDRRSGREAIVYRSNPDLTGLALGRVQFVEWTGADGKHHRARLYLPVGHVRDRRYPLVVQMNGYAGPEEYSLYGPGGVASVGLGLASTVNLGQLLAARGIAVLQVANGDLATIDGDNWQAAEAISAGLTEAIEHLVEQGIVDRAHVGIMAFSASGRYVEHALAFSDFPYAAAVIADHADANYLQSAIYDWQGVGASWYARPPFGSGLDEWRSHAPAFNVERIRTPIQYVVSDGTDGFGTLLWPWEMFTRLRSLGKPVEFYVVPRIDRGSHHLQNPHQVLALQARVLAWWQRWLTPEIDEPLNSLSPVQPN